MAHHKEKHIGRENESIQTTLSSSVVTAKQGKQGIFITIFITHVRVSSRTTVLQPMAVGAKTNMSN